MADPDDHPDFDLDTALSADLDGELDDYASALGTGTDVLRGRIDTPAARARRAELTAARDAAAAPPALDDVTRRRLLAAAGAGATDPAATRSGDRVPDRTWLYRAVAAAAVVLLVVGGVVVFNRGSDGSEGAKSSAGGGTTAATGDLGDVGTLDPGEVESLLRGEGTDAAKRSVAAPEQSGNQADDASSASVPGFVAGADTEAVADCAAQYASQGTVRFRGSGNYQGQPAVVLGIDAGARTIVFVVAADDCTRVLYSASR